MSKGELFAVTVAAGLVATVLGGLILLAISPAVLPTINSWYRQE